MKNSSECPNQSHRHCDIVVGDELVNSDYPEGGYKCTIANETRTPVGKGTNTYIYTFTYR